MEQISNTSRFNSTPFNTWKSAFRECVKLSSKVIDRQDNKETEARLDVWCNNQMTVLLLQVQKQEDSMVKQTKITKKH